MTTPADELRAAAEKLRVIAPFGDTRGPLAVWGPLADWLDETAAHLAATATPFWQEGIGRRPLAVARAINGGQP